MSRILFLIIFCLIGIIQLYQDWSGGTSVYVKPLIMLSLIWYYWVNSTQMANKKVRMIFLVGLIAAWTGDILLLDSNMFVFGLSSFLIMQICYGYCFWKDRKVGKKWWHYILVLGATASIVLYMIWPHAADMKIPIVCYMLAILLMSLMAYIRSEALRGYYLVLAGTLFFVISDSVIAIHRFTDWHLGSITVMLTYMIAQYTIVQGYLDKQMTPQL
jgi:uncharacterized membrane protein YhhN